MHLSWPIIRRAVACCLALGLLNLGTAGGAEEQKPLVVTGKISLPPEVARTPEPGQPPTAAAPESAPQGGRAESEATSSPRPQVVRQKIALPASGAQPPAAARAEPQPAEAPPAVAPPAAVPPAADVAAPGSDVLGPLAAGSDKFKAAYSYNPEGKIDPFEPLFRAKPKVEEKKAKPERPKRVPRTPLEMVDISQLKLSAIITAPSGNRALVEEASGKGYVIRAGTPIGINWGVVKEILIDRVIVEEEVENLMGDYVKRDREMKLNKPIGE